MHPIGAAAKRSGVAIETIRFYEREGIVPRPQRSASGRRLYADEDVRRLRFVKRCRALGFPLPHVQELLALSAGNEAPCANVKAIGERHIRATRKRIDDLAEIVQALERLVARCGDDRVDCPMLSTLLADSTSQTTGVEQR